MTTKFGSSNTTTTTTTTTTNSTTPSLSTVLAQSNISDGTDGQVLATNGSGTYGFANTQALVATAGVYRDGAQTMLNDTLTLVEWNGELWKSGITHSNTINPERLVITIAGVYNISAEVTINTSMSTGYFQMFISVNSDTALDKRRYGTQQTTDINLSTCATISLSVGDWISIVVYQNSGATRSMPTGDTSGDVWVHPELGVTLITQL